LRRVKILSLLKHLCNYHISKQIDIQIINTSTKEKYNILINFISCFKFCYHFWSYLRIKKFNITKILNIAFCLTGLIEVVVVAVETMAWTTYARK
jgi:hypothetical protein